jgi:hypothetical protein
MLGENDLLLGSLDGGEELGIVSFLELLTGLTSLLAGSCRRESEGTALLHNSQRWSIELQQPDSRLQLEQVPAPKQPASHSLAPSS